LQVVGVVVVHKRQLVLQAVVVLVDIAPQYLVQHLAVVHLPKQHYHLLLELMV
jgi:hypothetical protein